MLLGLVHSCLFLRARLPISEKVLEPSNAAEARRPAALPSAAARLRLCFDDYTFLFQCSFHHHITPSFSLEYTSFTLPLFSLGSYLSSRSPFYPFLFHLSRPFFVCLFLLDNSLLHLVLLPSLRTSRYHGCPVMFTVVIVMLHSGHFFMFST